jgi:hypothetical protein
MGMYPGSVQTDALIQRLDGVSALSLPVCIEADVHLANNTVSFEEPGSYAMYSRRPVFFY